MQFWWFYLAGTTVYQVYGLIGRIGQVERGWKAVNFDKEIKGRRLNSGVILEQDVDTESFCKIKCVDDERCVSYNFEISRNDKGKYKCQLCDTDRYVSATGLVTDVGFKYVGIRVSLD